MKKNKVCFICDKEIPLEEIQSEGGGDYKPYFNLCLRGNKNFKIIDLVNFHLLCFKEAAGTEITNEIIKILRAEK